MSLQSWQETLINSIVDGPTLTAAAAASAIPTAAKITLPPGFWVIGRQLRITAHGRISCAVTTPGTARFDVRVGGVIAFDSLALNLNVVAKTNVGFALDLLLTCRAQGNGTSANLIGQGTFQSEAVIGSPLPAVGGSGLVLLPVGSAPAVGTGFDSTAAQTLDLFFTQTVATGSLTVHQYKVESLN